jgi:hypothetical protein
MNGLLLFLIRLLFSLLTNLILLAKVLDGNDRASALLARAVHENVQLPLGDDIDLSSFDLISVAEESIGIWIDPIGKLPIFYRRRITDIRTVVACYRFVFHR